MPLLSKTQAASASGVLLCPRALLGIWGSWPLTQETFIEQENGTEVPKGDLWLQRERPRAT